MPCKRFANRRLAGSVRRGLSRRYSDHVNRWATVRSNVLVAVFVACTSAACAWRGASPRPFPMPPGPTSGTAARAPLPDDEALSGAEAIALVGTALDLRGIPYRNGGSSSDGFDCSGFTQYVYARHGVLLPRAVRHQFRMGRPVARDQMAAGDLVFFSMTKSGPSHVAIAIDGHAFVHAPSSRGVVRVERINSPYWATRFVGVRRLERQ